MRAGCQSVRRRLGGELLRIGARCERRSRRRANARVRGDLARSIRQRHREGLAYGGGSLWVGDADDAAHTVTEVHPRTGRQRTVRFDFQPKWLTWSEGYGDLWIGDVLGGGVSRMHAGTGDVKTYDLVAENPGYVLVQGDSVWVGNWSSPYVVRLPAVGSGQSPRIPLPVTAEAAGVTTLAAGAGSIWATIPDDHALWRIDPKNRTCDSNRAALLPMGCRHERRRDLSQSACARCLIETADHPRNEAGAVMRGLPGWTPV